MDNDVSETSHGKSRQYYTPDVERNRPGAAKMGKR